jgi:hypothetical protein
LQYYYVLRSILHTRPHLRKCLTRCRHCRIFFLTHPRNKGRYDLRCPFGCRQAHRKISSTKRSVEYYQTEHGIGKRKIQNDRRGKKERSVDSTDESSREDNENLPDEETLHYIQTVTSLIEARRVSLYEVLAMLKNRLKQHSMYKHKRFGYAFKYTGGEPP